MGVARRRGRGDGSIRQRPSGLWEAQLRYVDPITRFPQRLSVYGSSRAEVVAKLDGARTRLRAGRSATDEPIALSVFLQHWLDDVVKPTLRPATYRSYAGAVATINASKLGRVQLQQLREVQIQHVLVASAARTRSSELALVVLRRALSQAQRYGFISDNPAVGVATPKRARRELRHLSADQARAFLAAARADRLFALYYLALDTGLRQGELLALEWRDVDLDAGTLHVVRSLDNHTGTVGPLKTRSSRRQLVLGPAAIAVLRDHRTRGKLVFPNECGGYLSPQNIRNRSFLPLQLKAEIDPPIRFHDLRHTAATLMLEAGIHPKIVSERLGHASIAITMDTYQHVGPTLQADAAARLEQVLGIAAGGTNAGTVADLAAHRKRKTRRNA